MKSPTIPPLTIVNSDSTQEAWLLTICSVKTTSLDVGVAVTIDRGINRSILLFAFNLKFVVLPKFAAKTAETKLRDPKSNISPRT